MISAWRKHAAVAGAVLLSLDVVAYGVRLLLRRGLYEQHWSAMVILEEAGLTTAAVAFVLTLFEGRLTRKIVLIIASVFLSYLWFSDIAWWVMVK